MNREIKFRIWDKVNQQFTLLEDLYWFEENYVHSFNDENFVFQQYTGLKDRSGREIYEGDILKHQYSPSKNESTSVVRWSEEGEDNHPGFCITRLMTQGGEITVIGNIFENKSLLTENSDLPAKTVEDHASDSEQL